MQYPRVFQGQTSRGMNQTRGQTRHPKGVRARADAGAGAQPAEPPRCTFVRNDVSRFADRCTGNARAMHQESRIAKADIRNLCHQWKVLHFSCKPHLGVDTRAQKPEHGRTGKYAEGFRNGCTSQRVQQWIRPKRVQIDEICGTISPRQLPRRGDAVGVSFPVLNWAGEVKPRPTRPRGQEMPGQR